MLSVPRVFFFFSAKLCFHYISLLGVRRISGRNHSLRSESHAKAVNPVLHLHSSSSRHGDKSRRQARIAEVLVAIATTGWARRSTFEFCATRAPRPAE